VPPLNASPEESEDELLADQLDALNFSDRDSSNDDMDGLEIPTVNSLEGSQHRTDLQSTSSMSTINRMNQRLSDTNQERRESSKNKPIRIPDTPYESSVAKVVEKLREGGADRDTLQYLVDEVWPSGIITLEGLRAPMEEMELRVFGLPSESARFQGLFRVEGEVGCCLLCPRGRSLEFGSPMNGLVHVTIAHFEMGYRCQCGCKEVYWTGSNFKRHLKGV